MKYYAYKKVPRNQGSISCDFDPLDKERNPERESERERRVLENSLRVMFWLIRSLFLRTRTISLARVSVNDPSPLTYIYIYSIAIFSLKRDDSFHQRREKEKEKKIGSHFIKNRSSLHKLLPLDSLGSLFFNLRRLPRRLAVVPCKEDAALRRVPILNRTARFDRFNEEGDERRLFDRWGGEESGAYWAKPTSQLSDKTLAHYGF